MAMADLLLDRIHTTPRHRHDRRPPEGTTHVSKTRTMRADQLTVGDTIKGQGDVDTVRTQNGDIVVNFTNGVVRHFVPKDRLTVVRGT